MKFNRTAAAFAAALTLALAFAAPASAAESSPAPLGKALTPYLVTLAAAPGAVFTVQAVQSDETLTTVGAAATRAANSALSEYAAALDEAGFTRSASLEALQLAYAEAEYAYNYNAAPGVGSAFDAWLSAESAEIRASGNLAAIAAVDAFTAGYASAVELASEPQTITADADGRATFFAQSAHGGHPEWLVTAGASSFHITGGAGVLSEDSPTASIASQVVVAPGLRIVEIVTQ